MTAKFKKLNEQVIVLTGATSGIGLVTARRAAKQGAALVLAARNDRALGALAGEIERAGGQALAVHTDVAEWNDMQHLADVAINRFGRIDTWVNNAGVCVYGLIDQIPLSDHRRLFDTNFWGVVHGSLAALPHLRKSGGALINIGSSLSDRAVPLQGMYCASKHAIKGFTDALRMEVEKDTDSFAVTLIKPSLIDTPFSEHARNYMDREPDFPAPAYAPETVAEAILHCATHRMREVTVGGSGKALALIAKIAPGLTDRMMERFMFSHPQSSEPVQPRSDSLYEPGHDLDERSHRHGPVLEKSLYTKASLRPVSALAILAGAGLALALLLSGRRKT